MIEIETAKNVPANLRWPLMLLALTIACDSGAAVHALEATAVDKSSGATSIEPLFDCYAANSAWGLSYSGKVIGRDGRIWTYRSRGKALPVAQREHDVNYFAAGGLRAKYQGATASGQVDAKALADHVGLIDKAAAGKLERKDTGVRDAGTSECHAYQADVAGERYRGIELGSDGGVADRRTVNAAPEAKALLDWLHSVGVAR